MRTFVAVTLLSLLAAPVAAPVAAQISDLQPGRNFPTAPLAFGAGATSDVGVGDADNDGDLDVIVANGGNVGKQANKLYINDGGMQGGTPGSFTDETATRLFGAPLDTSRDIEFVDVDLDGDLDIYVGNRGTSVDGGEPSRFFTNRGGFQFGPVGFYNETSNANWGTLISIPLGDQVLGGNQGPFRDFSCDCVFADIDDDGDLDLFHSSYGLNLNGAADSRVFLNDGSGVYDELWPWADAGADTKTHTLDVDLVDIDNDLDLDVFMSSRTSQARVYRNNLADNGWSGDAFTDITQTALLDTGAAQNGTANYGVEYGDVDGDGDFDVWANSYDGFLNPILENNADGTFTKRLDWIKGDPAVDDNENDFMDYDGDGDLDSLVSGFAPGTNFIYTSGLAQGFGAAEGYLHRNGTAAGGSQATWPETPSAGNSGTTFDSAVADMDGDGDPDVIIGNDSNQQNRYWENVLGVPDTHAPSFRFVTSQGNKSDGSETVIHADVRDNSTYDIVGMYLANLIYSVDGGDETCVRMLGQGSQIFRGVIPAAVDGLVAYRVEVTDRSGNTGVSATTVYDQSSTATSDWQNLGCGTDGSYGVPTLQGRGTLAAGNTIDVVLQDAAPDAAALLYLSSSSAPAAFKGGTLYTIPIDLTFVLDVDDGGLIGLQFIVPGGLPSGFGFYWQFVIADSSATGGASLSNAMLSTTP